MPRFSFYAQWRSFFFKFTVTLERRPGRWILRRTTILGLPRILGHVQKPLSRRFADTVLRVAAQETNMVSEWFTSKINMGLFLASIPDGLAIVPLSKCFLCPLSDIFVRLCKRYMTTSKFLFFSHLYVTMLACGPRETLWKLDENIRWFH